jgi:hypothetical protein
LFRRTPTLSYEGALRVLGKYDHPWLDKADVFFGVSILVGGAVEPSLLGLVDPKNEATASLRKLLDGITRKLTGLAGVHRHDLIVAAHTIIAVAAVFDAFRDEIGTDFDGLEITDREKFHILGMAPGGKTGASALPILTRLEIPPPDAVRGFHENLNGALVPFFNAAVGEVISFIDGLGARPSRLGDIRSAVSVTSREKYIHHYLGLAAAIPEFRIWAMLGEHAATRAQVDVKFREALAAIRTDSLELFSQLLSELRSGAISPRRSYRKKLEDAATAVLAKPLLRGSSDTSSIDVAFPTVERGFVAPGYRVAEYDEKMQTSSEDWWKQRKVRDDIDAFLAAHLSGRLSTVDPLLVLGNPGAGKSLLMEVLAARLPAEQFTVVMVQLRKVRAADQVHAQIETALTDLFAERVGWGTLVDECDDTTRVVLLDGFDELIQASGVHKSTYIQEVKDFQERQADLGRPVAVVITSRTLVADRARIPLGAPVIKLEEFDDGRIDRWLAAWNDANTGSSLIRTQLARHAELARQPLLLLMLAIYAADPGNPSLDDENLSNAELYGRLIRSFVLRQVREKGPVRPSEEHIETRAERSWWQLGIAGLAMFNRGRQYVTDDELNHDLAIFAPTEETPVVNSLDTPVSDADRTLENFFFIHSPSLNDETENGRRTYEFLHATFGEYLVADVALILLKQMVAARALQAVNPYQRTAPPNDNDLYALMSHQVFTKRKTVLEFAAGLFAALDGATRTGVLRVLDDLIRSFHDRARSDPYPAYDPAGSTLVSRIAIYSANLVCLRVILNGSIPVKRLFPCEEDELDEWRATVRLWQSGLDGESWQSLVDVLTLVHSETWCITRRADRDSPGRVLGEAQLLGDAPLEGALRAGMMFVSDDTTSAPEEQSLLGKLVRWIISTPGTAGRSRALPFDVGVLNGILDKLDAGTRMSPAAKGRMSSALSREACRLPRSVVERALRHLMPPESLRPFELIAVGCAHPGLIDAEILLAELDKLLSQDPDPALGVLVLTWLTATSDVDDGFLEFAEKVGETVEPYVNYLSSLYLPIEVFDYLASPRAVEPRLDKKLLVALGHVSHAVAGAVEPRTFLNVIERFVASEARPADEEIALFIVEYLTDRGADVSELDLPSALDMLRRLVNE